MRSLTLSKQALLLLLIGMMIRLPSLVSPISEGHRNAQTATLTAGMLENGELRLDPIAPWRGDLDARIEAVSGQVKAGFVKEDSIAKRPKLKLPVKSS